MKMTLSRVLYEPCSPCCLSNRAGTFFVAGISSAVYSLLLLTSILTPDHIRGTWSLPSDAQYSLVVYLIVGVILSFMLFTGAYWNQIFLCLPWMTYAAFNVMLHFFGLIYAASYSGPPFVTHKSLLMIIFILLYLVFGLHVYIFWVVLTFVLDLKDSTRSYEKFPDSADSKSSSRVRNNVRSSVFQDDSLEDSGIHYFVKKIKKRRKKEKEVKFT